VDLFDPIFQVNQVYYISKGTVKSGNPRYTKAEFEITLSKNSVVKLVQEAQSNVPKARYNFSPIDHIQDLPADNLVDVCGVITEVGASMSLKTKKDGRTTTKRTVTIVDATMRRVDITLWAEKAENFDHTEGTLFVGKNLRTTDYMGHKSLSVVTSSQLEFNAVHAQAVELMSWYKENREQILSGGAPNISGSHTSGDGGDRSTSQGTLQELVDETTPSDGTPANPKGVFKKVVCTIMWIKHDENSMVYYKAVPLPDGRAKVVESNGRYQCPSTGQIYDTYIPRFMITVLVGDASSSRFVSVFDDYGSVILGADAKTVEQLREGPNANEQQFNAIFEAALYQRYALKLKAKEEFYGDAPQTRITVYGVEKVNYAEQCRNIISSLKPTL